MTSTRHRLRCGVGTLQPRRHVDRRAGLRDPAGVDRRWAGRSGAFPAELLARVGFLSINGTTDLAQFDNQNDGGDFGDWQSNPLPGGTAPRVQDAFATPGAHPTLGLTSPEAIVLDVIGYNAALPNAVPEPGTLSLVALAFAAVGFSRRPRGRG